MILHVALCPLFWAPWIYSYVEKSWTILLLETYEPDVWDFVLDCPLYQTGKGIHLKPGSELQPLEVPTKKWDHVTIDFITRMPIYDNKDTIFTIVDKATKMCHFIPCAKIISAKRFCTFILATCRVFHRLLLAIGTQGLQGNSSENFAVF